MASFVKRRRTHWEYRVSQGCKSPGTRLVQEISSRIVLDFDSLRTMSDLGKRFVSLAHVIASFQD